MLCNNKQGLKLYSYLFNNYFPVYSIWTILFEYCDNYWTLQR